jgi:hypothetical protein
MGMDWVCDPAIDTENPLGMECRSANPMRKHRAGKM